MGEFTYEYLFDVVRRERSRDEVQELDADFYHRAQIHLQRQADELRTMDVLSHSGDELRTQLQNSKKLLKELYDRREKKVMFLALNRARTGSNIVDTSRLLSTEQHLFDSVVSSLTSSRFRVLSPTKEEMAQLAAPPAQETASETSTTPPIHNPSTSPSPKQTQQESTERIVKPGNLQIRFTASVPKFMGSQAETYGPFEEGSEAELPERIANILIKKGRAEQA